MLSRVAAGDDGSVSHSAHRDSHHRRHRVGVINDRRRAPASLATGLAQLLERTREDLGVLGIFDPEHLDRISVAACSTP
jgi:hypothetical protein